MSGIAYAIAGVLAFAAAIVWGLHRFGYHDNGKGGDR